MTLRPNPEDARCPRCHELRLMKFPVTADIDGPWEWGIYGGEDDAGADPDRLVCDRCWWRAHPWWYRAAFTAHWRIQDQVGGWRYWRWWRWLVWKRWTKAARRYREAMRT